MTSRYKAAILNINIYLKYGPSHASINTSHLPHLNKKRGVKALIDIITEALHAERD